MRLAVAALALALFAACGGGGSSDDPNSSFGTLPVDLAGCGTSTSLYSTLPFDAANLMGWVPLGALNPSGHTFPTDHQYIYLNSFGQVGGPQPVNLYAPAAVTIVGARLSQYVGQTPPADYSLMFSACSNTWVEFGHVRTIAPNIAAQLPPFDQGCNTYSPNPGSTTTACWTKATNIKVSAGDIIGTAAGLDLTMFDNRVAPIVYANPSRWTGGLGQGFDHFHVVPFSDYYAEPLRTTVQGMLGRFDGTVKRTIPPIGGTLATDIAGTVQGTWFFGAAPTYPENPHLAIVPDNVDPTVIDISMGTSGGAFTTGLTAMIPSASGPFNRHPAQISPGSTVYCWDMISAFDFGTGYGVALIELVDTTTLMIEGRLGPANTCANQPQPLALSAAAVTYKR